VRSWPYTHHYGSRGLHLNNQRSPHHSLSKSISKLHELPAESTLLITTHAALEQPHDNFPHSDTDSTQQHQKFPVSCIHGRSPLRRPQRFQMVIFGQCLEGSCHHSGDASCGRLSFAWGVSLLPVLSAPRWRGRHPEPGRAEGPCTARGSGVVLGRYGGSALDKERENDRHRHQPRAGAARRPGSGAVDGNANGE
jgi:hypothetical protein